MSDPEDNETVPREDLDELDRWVFDDPWDDPEVQRDADQPTAEQS